MSYSTVFHTGTKVVHDIENIYNNKNIYTSLIKYHTKPGSKVTYSCRASPGSAAPEPEKE